VQNIYRESSIQSYSTSRYRFSIQYTWGCSLIPEKRGTFPSPVKNQNGLILNELQRACSGNELPGLRQLQERCTQQNVMLHAMYITIAGLGTTLNGYKNLSFYSDKVKGNKSKKNCVKKGGSATQLIYDEPASSRPRLVPEGIGIPGAPLRPCVGA